MGPDFAREGLRHKVEMIQNWFFTQLKAPGPEDRGQVTTQEKNQWNSRRKGIVQEMGHLSLLRRCWDTLRESLLKLSGKC